MYLRRNFSFNQKNITQKPKKNKKKENDNSNNLIRLNNNLGKINLREMDDILFCNKNIATLKNQIFSPENDEDIYLYNNNKKMEKNINYEDEKNNSINIKYLTSRSLKSINYSIEKKQDKKTLILDLDETLVHSLFEQEKINNNIIKPDIYLKIFFNNKYQEIFVYKRPFIDIFLKEMNNLFNIFIFTASIELYAKPLLKKIDKNNLIKKKFYRESCLLSKGKFIKNLNALNLKLKDVIIIDNNPVSYKYNKNNGIPIKPWHCDKGDTELVKIIPLLKYLAKCDDVRKYIPFIVKKDEINFEYINSLLINSSNKNSKRINMKNNNISQKQKICRTINYNNFNNNETSIRKNSINHNPETINFVEPRRKIILNNFSKNKYINNNSFLLFRNDKKENNLYKKNLSAINFNSSEIENFYKSYNNFYINGKFSFILNQEKKKQNEKDDIKNISKKKNYEENDNLNNKISERELIKMKKRSIPISKPNLDKNKNKISKIFKLHKHINKQKTIIKHCSSYKNYTPKINHFSNTSNVLSPLININNKFDEEKKNNIIKRSNENNLIKYNLYYNNRNNNYNSLKNNQSLNTKKNIGLKTKYMAQLENNKSENPFISIEKSEKYNQNFGINYALLKNTKSKINEKNELYKKKIKIKNILYRNNYNEFKENKKLYSYSNFQINN